MSSCDQIIAAPTATSRRKAASASLIKITADATCRAEERALETETQRRYPASAEQAAWGVAELFLPYTVAAIALALYSSATAAELPRQPNGKWIVNFADAQCVARRNYGTEKNPLYLVLKQPPLGDTMVLSIVDERPAGPPTEFKGTIRFAAGPPQTIRVVRFTPDKSKLRVFMTNLPLEKFSPARSASTLAFRTSGLEEMFAVSQVAPLLDVMQTCMDDLRRVWNVDETVESKNTVREDEKGELRGLFRGDDYPWEAVRRGDSGTVKIVLLVDEAGKVADCSVVETSGAAVLDSQSCAIVKERAKFAPALGPDGKPRKDAFIQRIRWVLR